MLSLYRAFAELKTQSHLFEFFFRHFECNVQEFYLKVDKGFIYSIRDWYDAATVYTAKSDEQVIKQICLMLEVSESMFNHLCLLA